MTSGGESLLSIIFRFVNFAILLFILIRFAGRPLKKYLMERHLRIKDEIESKRKAIEETQTLREELEKKISAVDVEIEEMKRNLIEEAQKERERMISEANAFVNRLKEQIALMRQQELKEMTLLVKEEVAKRVIEEAENIIRERLKKEDHDLLVKDFIERLRGLS